jgi:hypothetical protein
VPALRLGFMLPRHQDICNNTLGHRWEAREGMSSLFPGSEKATRARGRKGGWPLAVMLPSKHLKAPKSG